MTRKFSHGLGVAIIAIALINHTLLPWVVRGATPVQPTPTSGAAAPGVGSHGFTLPSPTKLKKLRNLDLGPGIAKLNPPQGPGPSYSSQAAPGPFKSIVFTGDGLRFKLSRAGGVFVEPLAATINGLAFPNVTLKPGGIKLTLSGNPGGNNLEALFPNGGSAGLRIINGDGVRLYFVIARNGDTVSVLPPSVSDSTPRHATPGSVINVSGANFSPTPEDNTVIYTVSDGKEFQFPVINSTPSQLQTIMPSISVSADLQNFYSGAAQIRVQTANGYNSNTASCTIDPFPANSKSPGVVSRELSQQLEVMISQIEDSLASGFAQQGLDVEVIKTFKEVSHLSLNDFMAMVNDAISDHPQSIALDANGGGQEDEVLIDKAALDNFERLINSLKLSQRLNDNNQSLSRKKGEVQALATSGDCPGYSQYLENLSRYTAEFINTIESLLKELENAETVTIASALIAGYKIGGVNGALAALKIVKPVLWLVGKLELVLKAFKVPPNFTQCVLSKINVQPDRRTIRVGEGTDFSITGTFVTPLGDAIGSTLGFTLSLFQENLEERLKGAISDQDLKALVGPAMTVFGRLLDDTFSHYFGDIVNQRIDVLPEVIPLSSLTTHVTPSSNEVVQIGDFCNGTLSVQALRETPGVDFKAYSDFPRVVNEGVRTSSVMKVVVPGSAPAHPLISDIAPTAATAGTFDLTINGSGFDPSTAEVVISGPGCPDGSCIRRNADLRVKTSTQIIVALQINNPGTFIVSVRNGAGGTLFNGKILAVTNPPRSPVAAFRMSANGMEAREGERLNLIAPAGQPINVAFSGARSYDPNGGSLSFDWQIDGRQVSTARDFTSPLPVGTHIVSLAVENAARFRTSVTATVTVTAQEQSQPLISGVSPGQATVGLFNLTITGSSFNPGTSEVILSGPSCTGGCVVPNTSLLSKTPTQIIAPVRINNPGTFTVAVRNGTGGRPSNEKQLIVTGTSHQPVISLNPPGLNFSVQQGASGDAKILDISNAGGGTLNWVAAVTTSSGGQWLSLSYSNGQAPSSTTVRVDSVRLQPGVYNGQVTISASGATNSPQTIPVALNVSGQPTSPPTLSVSPSSGQQLVGTFTYSGTNYTPNGTVNRFITFPNGQTQQISSITASASGQVSWTFSPTCTDPVGTSTVWAVDVGTNRQSNNVSQTVTANASCSPSPTLSISPSSGQQQTTTFNYAGSNYTPNGTINRFITFPNGQTQQISSITANSSGQINWTFSPSCSDPVGTSTVWAVDVGTNRQSNNVSQVVTANASCSPAPTLSISPASGQQLTTTFNYSGSNYTPGGTVNRFITFPNGQTQQISSITANASGQIGWTFTAACSDPVGTSTVWAVDVGTNRQSNNVSQTVTANPNCSPNPTLSISPSSGQQTVVTFTYSGSNYTPSGTVNRFITFPNGQTQQISSITANASGQVSWTFSPTCADPVGTSTVWAVDATTNRQSNNVTQTVTANPACSPVTLNSSPASVQQANGTFTVTGSNYTPNGTVRRFIIPPGGSQQEISSTTANASGQVNWTFAPSCTDPVGTTTLWAVDAATNRQSNTVTQTVTANPICSPPTLNSSPASVQQANGTFTVTGSNYTPSGTVRRFIIPPGGSQQEISSTTANASGQVNWTFSPSCTDPVGTTTLWAVDASTNRQSNNVTQTVTANPSCSPAPTLNSSPASVQQANGTFTVTGNNYTPNGTVRRFIIPPGGSQQEISSTTANASGQVNWTFAPSCNDPVGTTTLWAVDAATNRQSNNVTQTVTSNSICSPPTLSSSPASVQQANGTFTVTGGNYTPNGTVRRFIIPPGGSQQEISSTTANASGQVNWTFAPSCNDPVGTTTLWAIDAATNRQSNNVTQTVTANSICNPPTLNSSPPSVQQVNGAFTVTGSNYTPNGTVRRFIIPPGGSQQEISSTTANASGQVNWTFAPSCSDPVGTTTLWAVDAATNRQSNNVTQTVNANPICSPPPTLSISPSSGQQTVVTFTYSGSNYTPNGTVNRFITFPNGQTQQISSITANASGQISWTFRPTCADQVGTSTVWAVDAGTSRQSNTVGQTVTHHPSCP